MAGAAAARRVDDPSGHGRLDQQTQTLTKRGSDPMQEMGQWPAVQADVILQVHAESSARGVTRRVARLPTGLVRIDQEMHGASRGTGLDVTGPYWVLAFVRIHAGQLAYLHGSQPVQPPGSRFAVFFPPYSIVECTLDRVHARSFAVAGRQPAACSLPDHPIAFRTSRRLPRSVQEAAAILREAHSMMPIGREHGARPISARVKAIIDASYADLPPLAALAARLRTSPAVLSRYFKRDYGLPPTRYRHAIRVMDAMMRLIGGASVCDVSGRVGFGELSQLYQQFRPLALAPPARYRPRSRIPKTS